MEEKVVKGREVPVASRSGGGGSKLGTDIPLRPLSTGKKGLVGLAVEGSVPPGYQVGLPLLYLLACRNMLACKAVFVWRRFLNGTLFFVGSLAFCMACLSIFAETNQQASLCSPCPWKKPLPMHLSPFPPPLLMASFTCGGLYRQWSPGGKSSCRPSPFVHFDKQPMPDQELALLTWGPFGGRTVGDI